jgi:uncharacterized membrane protein YcjF (UPF0283 family)
MRKMQIWKTLIATLMLLLPGVVAAQGDDFYRQAGKIYVVVAVLGVIFVGIIAFLIWMEFKLSRLERQVFNPNDKK